MGAYSVTGKGPGMSNGEYKQENNCGCGCCGATEEDVVATEVKTYCKVNYSSNSGSISVNTGGNLSTAVCA
jgi:hypothetical protein